MRLVSVALGVLCSACGGGPGGDNAGGDAAGEGGDTATISTDDGVLGSVQLPTDILVEPYQPTDAAPYLATDRIATFGLPLPQGLAIPIVGGRPQLSVVGSDTWQFEALDTWPDGSVKWALGRARVVVGQGVKPTLTVETGAGDSGQDELVRAKPDGWLVDTGPLQATVRYDGLGLFEHVVVDGTEIVRPGSSPGLIATAAATGDPLVPLPGAVVLLEENGPARSALRWDGTLGDASGEGVIDVTLRLAFEAGSRDVVVVTTVRNANLERPQHTLVGSVELGLRIVPEGGLTALFAVPDGVQEIPLPAGTAAHAYQAYSDSNTDGVEGPGPGYLPHIPKLDANTLAEEGFRLVVDGEVTLQTSREEWPEHGWMDLSAPEGGVTVAIREMPFLWPAGLEAIADGTAMAGVFTARNAVDYTFTWRQHESRTALFAFHAGDPADPEQCARRLDAPVFGRLADPNWLRASGTIPYDLVTPGEQEAVYAALGLDHAPLPSDKTRRITRFLPAHQTGGSNNEAIIEKHLLDHWQRFGSGGALQRGLELALYKSEWQILRSDGFHHGEDPGAIDDEVPHTTNHEGDKEHRYRAGILWAYYLTGDPRYREALLDEAEILPTLAFTPQERSAYQTLRALVHLARFTDDQPELQAPLVDAMRSWLAGLSTPLLDVETGADGYGWETLPGLGERGYYVNSSQGQSEKPPGENYVTRGFISATLGPIAFHLVSDFLGPEDPDGLLAADRLLDLATYARGELHPWFDDPADRHLAYSYGVQLQTVHSFTSSDHHTLLLAMAEGWRLTCDPGYLVKAVEMIESFEARGHLDEMDTRLDHQHFFHAYLESLDGVD